MRPVLDAARKWGWRVRGRLLERAAVGTTAEAPAASSPAWTPGRSTGSQWERTLFLHWLWRRKSRAPCLTVGPMSWPWAPLSLML